MFLNMIYSLSIFEEWLLTLYLRAHILYHYINIIIRPLYGDAVVYRG